MNKGQLAEQLLGKDLSYDFALPQPWVDDLFELVKLRGFDNLFTYHDIVFGFVWLYDKQASIFGRPYPLTYKAKRMLEILKKYKTRDNIY